MKGKVHLRAALASMVAFAVLSASTTRWISHRGSSPCGQHRDGERVGAHRPRLDWGLDTVRKVRRTSQPARRSPSPCIKRDGEPTERRPSVTRPRGDGSVVTRVAGSGSARPYVRLLLQLLLHCSGLERFERSPLANVVTDLNSSGSSGLGRECSSPCQGEGRGFESRRPLQSITAGQPQNLRPANSVPRFLPSLSGTPRALHVHLTR